MNYRLYGSIQSLEAFYPNEKYYPPGKQEALQETAFLPLEILVDQRSEVIDYDRVVQKADFAISYDKFNPLRVSHGLDWPRPKDDPFQTVSHLRMHQVR